MRRRVALSCISCILFSTLLTMGQDQASFQVLQFQGPQYANILMLDFGSMPADKADRWFVQPSAPGRSLDNYSIYVILQPDTSAMRVCDESRDYLDATRPLKPECVIPESNAPPPTTRASPQLTMDSFTKTVGVPLLKPLHADAHYIIAVRNPEHESIEVPFNNSASLITPDAAKVTTELKVKATVTLKAAVGQAVTVSRAEAKGPTAGTDVYPATVSRIDNDGVVLSLQRKLPSGKATMQLEVKGLTDYYGKAVKVQSKVQSAPGAPSVSSSGTNPTNVSSAFVTTQLSAIAAVHSSPTFAATGAIAPWHPATRMILLPGEIFFDPTVTFNVGSANANSSNSVIVPSEFSRAFVFGLPSDGSNIDPATLVTLAGKRPIGLNVTFGPRAEFDTQHAGVNLLAEARAELYLPQLSKSVDVQKAAIAAGNPAIRDLLELPTNGFSVAPYLQFDAGGHLNSQTISNPMGLPAASISTYDISRLYLGLHGTAQLGRNTLNLDGSWVNLFLAETVPITVKNIVNVRTISGFQPHTKATYSFYLDDAKHFAGSICWENGRTAPSFQYLNKVTVGLQVVY